VETKDGVKLVPWAPTASKVGNVLDALKAIGHLEGALEAPAWIETRLDDRSGQGGQGNDPLLLANEFVVVVNGLLHVPTRMLLPHTPAFFCQNRLPYSFDENAVCPSWLDFLHDLWPDDEQSIATLQEVFGYVIGGDTSQQKIFLLVGPKRSGKGTIARVLTGLLGKHNVAAPTLAGLSANFGLQELITRPLGLISDARLSSRTDSGVVVERLLSISGEDSIQVDRKYRDPWNGKLPTRFVILTNELPKLLDSSGALASRFVLLLLKNSFYGKENLLLTKQLLEEAPGILNWALEGLDRLNDRGYFVMPGSSNEVVRQMEDLSSPVGAFVRTNCEIGGEWQIEVDEIWRSWREWCQDQNLHPGTKATFGRDLKAVAPSVAHARPRGEDDKRVQVYMGIRLAGKTFAGHPDHPDQGSAIGVSGHVGQGGQGTSSLFSAPAREAVEEEIFQ
jgi:putative DNA primase/helicase